MSDVAFNNFLSNKGYGPIMKDFQHASKLYVDSGYAKAPKVGFIYFIEFDIPRNTVIRVPFPLKEAEADFIAKVLELKNK